MKIILTFEIDADPTTDPDDIAGSIITASIDAGIPVDPDDWDARWDELAGDGTPADGVKT